MTTYDNDIITVTLRNRIRGGFGEFYTRQMTIREARELRGELSGRTYANTKIGDTIFVTAHGTLSQLYASGATA